MKNDLLHTSSLEQSLENFSLVIHRFFHAFKLLKTFKSAIKLFELYLSAVAIFTIFLLRVAFIESLLCACMNTCCNN
jgi:hypothetical protein